MGDYGFDVFPYYEYCGSKGKNGLGSERRPKPLNRPDGYYTHIKWLEKGMADITDPDTFEDFRKMVELTIIQHKTKANFIGVWLRPRSQLPVSFSQAAIERFNTDTKQATPITRDGLINDKQQYHQYVQWWENKRRDFLVQVRDYLRSNGIDEGRVLLTNNPAEPGVSFIDGVPHVVTDQLKVWGDIVQQPTDAPVQGKKSRSLHPKQSRNVVCISTHCSQQGRIGEATKFVMPGLPMIRPTMPMSMVLGCLIPLTGRITSTHRKCSTRFDQGIS